jgi:serine/threonine-protein kinase
MAAQGRSSPYAVAPSEWRYDETEPPFDAPPVRPLAPSRPSRLPWIIAVISVLVAAATGVMLYLKLTAEKPGPLAQVAPIAAVSLDAGAAVVAIDAAGETTMTMTATAEVMEPTIPEEQPVVEDPLPPKVKKAQKKLAKVEPKLEKHEPKIEPKVEPKVDPPKVEKGPPGMITIDSAPVYAVIYIDGKKLGETPLVNIKLAPGKHAVRAVSPSGATKTLSITIEAGKTAPPRKISW